jgi:CspA family cold shock protein
LQEEQQRMAEGTIKRKTNRGFGFIRTNRGRDIYFDMAAVDGVTFAELREGQRVSYTEITGGTKPRAENVKLI